MKTLHCFHMFVLATLLCAPAFGQCPLKDAGASAAQLKQIKAVLKKTHHQVNDLHTSLQKSRSKLHLQISTDVSKTAALHAEIEKIQQLQTTLAKTVVSSLTQSKKILGKKIWTQVRSRFIKHAQRAMMGKFTAHSHGVKSKGGKVHGCTKQCAGKKCSKGKTGKTSGVGANCPLFKKNHGSLKGH